MSSVGFQRPHLGILLVVCLTAWLSAGQVLDVGSSKQLFLDGRVIEKLDAARRVWNQPVKYEGNPIMRGEQPWENWVVYPDGGPVVLFDKEERIFKMWYQTFHADGRSSEYRQRYIMCYATSRDGLHWKKPNLGAIEWKGSRENNIVAIGNRGLIDTNVIKDARDPDPGRRYKTLYYDTDGQGGPLGISVGFSADGIHWNLHPENPVLVGTGDTHTLLGWDESVGRYVAYLRPKAEDNRKLGEGGDRIRVIGRSVSDDFLHWRLPEIIIVPDEADDPDVQFYGMPAFQYEGHYVGILWVFHTLSLLLDNHLAFSRDGVEWHRPQRRNVFLPLGAPGTWEDGMSYATTPIIYNDEIYIYYGGFNVIHNLDTQETLGSVAGGRRREGAIGLARLRLDGFASLDAAFRTATVTTRILRFSGSRLLLNIQPSMKGRGAVDELSRFQVEITTPEGTPLPGYSFQDSADLAQGGIRTPATWKGNEDFSSLAGQRVRLRFRYRNAKFYSFQFEPAP